MCYEDSTDSQGVLSRLQGASRVYVVSWYRWAGTQHTFSSPASQGNRAQYSCSPGKAKLHDLLFHLQVSTGHANLDNCTAAIFLHTNQPQFSWINSPVDWNLARFSLTGTRRSPLFPPVFIKHLFLSLQRKYHFLIAIYTFKLSLCSSGGNGAPFCSLTSNSFKNLLHPTPPNLKQRRINGKVFCSIYLWLDCAQHKESKFQRWWNWLQAWLLQQILKHSESLYNLT